MKKDSSEIIFVNFLDCLIPDQKQLTVPFNNSAVQNPTNDCVFTAVNKIILLIIKNYYDDN